jgi:hypothetical protein
LWGSAALTTQHPLTAKIGTASPAIAVVQTVEFAYGFVGFCSDFNFSHTVGKQTEFVKRIMSVKQIYSAVKLS